MCVTGREGGRYWGGERVRRETGKGEEWFGGSGSCDSKLYFITSFFFFNHSTVCPKKVKPIERKSATFLQLLLGEPTESRLMWVYQMRYILS